MEINKPTCTTTFGNTGIGSCEFNPDMIRGALRVPIGWTQALADIDDIVADIQADILATSHTDRIFPISRFITITDNSEAPTINTSGYGDKEVVKDGAYDWTFLHKEGGFSLHRRLRRNNANNCEVLLWDKNNVLWGTLAVDGGMKGITTDYLYEEKVKMPDGTNMAQYNLHMVLPKPEQLNEYAAYVQLTSDPEDLFKGLIDLELVQVSVAAGKATIKVQTKCEGVNLYDTYSTALASAALWTCAKAGAAVTITGVVADDDTSAFEVSFTGTGVHTIGLTNPTALETAGVGGLPANGGFELFETLDVTMPAP